MNQVVNEKKFIESRLNIPYSSLSQSYLRAETSLTTQSTISFQLQTANVASPIVTEKLLNLNDIFVLTHVTIGCRQVLGSLAANVTALQQLNAEFLTYNDPKTFTLANALNIGTIFNSSLSWSINRKEYIPAISTRSFLRVPTIQTSGFLTTAGTVAVPVATYTGNFGVNGYDNSLYGFVPFEPTVITGRDTLNVQINLGTSVAFLTGTNSIYATMEVRGYLVVNAKS